MAILVLAQSLFMILPLGNVGGNSDNRGWPASRRATENGVPAAEPAPASVLVPHPVVELQNFLVPGGIKASKVLVEPC